MNQGQRVCMMAAVLSVAASTAWAAPTPEAKRKHGHAVSTSMGAATLQFPKSGVVKVPFKRGQANHVLVETQDADGVIRVFAIDTGASFSVLTPNYMKSQPQPESDDEEKDGSEVVEAIGAHGSIGGQREFTEMRHLSIGKLAIERAGAVSMDIPNLDEGLGEKISGIIGYNVLSQMTTVVDYQANEIVFIEPDSDREAKLFGDPDLIVPFRLRMGALIEVDGQIDDGEAMPFVYDIGSPRTMLNETASKSTTIDFQASNVEDLDRIRALNNDLKVEAGVAQSLRFGPLSFEKPTIYSMNLPIFSMLGHSESNAGLLGNDMFDGHRVAIDYEKKELRIWKLAPATP